MAKDNRPKEKMQLTIEFADNGIILRDPAYDDLVTLALTGEGVHKENGFGYDFPHDEEYKAIGQKIYNWLVELVVPEYSGTWISTGAELDITATMTGRKYMNKD